MRISEAFARMPGAPVVRSEGGTRGTLGPSARIAGVALGSSLKTRFSKGEGATGASRSGGLRRTRLPIVLGPLAVVAIVLSPGCGSSDQAGARVKAPEPTPRASKAPPIPKLARVVLPKRPVGAGACAACHGNIRPADPSASRILRNEHTIWVTQDEHANAFQVLSSSRATAIATALSGGKLPARQDTRCLACHTVPGLDPTAGDEPAQAIRRDGVGCESCHGSANRWLGTHQQTAWRRLSPSEKEAFGMTPLKDLERRAEVCAGCHVGSPSAAGHPAREVGHDLIKAGHSRLNFAFVDYLARMPHHWREDISGAFPARAWAIGQVVSAKSALELLHARARAATAEAKAGDAPWPERSEYDCFSCHHDPETHSWRNPPGAEGGTGGTPQWGTWYYPMVLALAQQVPDGKAKSFTSLFATLRTTMGEPIPPPDRVAEEADEAAQALNRWLRSFAREPFDLPKVRGLLDAVDSPAHKDAGRTWDMAAQRYLALKSLRPSLKALDPTWPDELVTSELDALSRRFESPEGPDRPRGFDPGSLFKER